MIKKRRTDQRPAFPRLSVHGPVRRLAIVFGDQLDPQSRALTGLDKSRDAIVLIEAAEESTHVPSHKQRTVLFLSAMRHFALDLHLRKYRAHYVRLDDPKNSQSFAGELERVVVTLKPERLLCTQPGEWRVKRAIEIAAKEANVPLQVLPDEHFLVGDEQFAARIGRRKQPVMEHFYREQRRKLGVLMESTGEPTGGMWNYEKENRIAFSKAPDAPRPYTPRPDGITNEVLDLVGRCFASNPGTLARFRWSVTRAQAQRALNDFITNRLPYFGTYQDAMWSGQPFLYHALLSAALNLKLLDPRDCVAAAMSTFESGMAPLNCVEGFIRQIIGWREFIRGIYWHEGPSYGARNELDQHGILPSFYWTAETDMVCMRECLGQVLEYGYGHHIQRLMVTGNFALTAGVDPRRISDWYLAMYVDAVDWVTLPNTLGMVMHADGGVVSTKPYAASGRYTQRMSNYCKTCRCQPARRTGAEACPFNVFYWDFLIRNRQRFRGNRRMALILKHVDRMDEKDGRETRAHAQHLRAQLGVHGGHGPRSD